jgi:spore coat protein U-like protein
MIRVAMLALSASLTLPAHACQVVSVADIAHGVYSVFGTTDEITNGHVRLRNCSADYAVKLSTGISGSYAVRTLVSGGDTLQYNLYTTSARTDIWGDGTAGTTFMSYPAHNNPLNRNIFSKIPRLQDVAVGSYSDSITITIEF